jgi:hypothetical protein
MWTRLVAWLFIVVVATGIGSLERVAAAGADPGDVTAFRGHVGEVMTFTVTGTIEGRVWGTEIYTDDSTLAAAAVHAGVLRAGQVGDVTVRILGPQQSFRGTRAHWIDSRDYGAWDGSFRFVGPGTNIGIASLPDPGDVTRYRGHVGEEFTFTVTGTTAGSVWGHIIFTDDSKLTTAAVHAGVLRAGQTGDVTVRILGPQQSFRSWTSHGITTKSYGYWDGSFTFVGGGSAGAQDDHVLPNPGNLVRFRAQLGDQLTFLVNGSGHQGVWGTDIYSDNSDLGTAAVHAGLLKVGETGKVTVELLPGQSSYEGSKRNGVSSGDFQRWPGSYRFVGSSK